MSLPISFLNPDSPDTPERLAKTLRNYSGDAPILGIVIKMVQRPDGREEFVNFEPVDGKLIRGLALAMRLADGTPIPMEA